ncbi:thiolase family protein [Bacillus sp. 1P10SD]|uniref:thiolase family protein n=1 Tax=Bacillus sp. 1P10SD TaxID=3132265 RepID=UPI0039A56479
MSEVYIVAAARSAIGKFGGSLQSYSSSQLGSTVVQACLNRSSITGEQIDEVIIGNVFQAGGKGNPARQIVYHSGLPLTVPAMTINKQCASGMRAVSIGYHQIKVGESDAIVVGGTESMTNVPHLLLDSRWGKKLGDAQAVDGLLYDGLHCAIEGYHMGVTAENLVAKYGISREEQDLFAFESHKKTLDAIKEGRFRNEIVPIKVMKGKQEINFDTDEHPQNTSLEKLGQLKPVFKENGTVTAGNSSGLNDGAAALILVSGEKVKEWGLKPLARIRSAASSAVLPSIMGIGPVPSTIKALEKAKLTIKDIDLFELNEAFAAQALAVINELKIPRDKLNVNGGAIALGHPVGCSGARILVTLIHELIHQNKTLGLATLCVGGGQGTTMIIERV